MGMFDKGSPYEVTLEAGQRVSLCQCGHSAKAPLCDGSHKAYPGTGPQVYEAQSAQSIWVCGCGRSGKNPLCDGSHNKV